MNRLMEWLGRDGQGPGKNGQIERPLCIVQHFDRMSPQVESYRSLRTAIELVAQSTPFKTLLMASPGPMEGKSTTLINLGILFWELGRRVLLVDSDLRRGCLHQVFGLPRAPGLTDLILSQAETLFPIHELRPGFSVMTCGSHYDKPAVLLGSPGLRQALALFQERADIILLDSSPLLAVSDSVKLIQAAHAVLLVVRAGRTSRGDAAKVRKLLQASRANVLGVVVNGVEDSGLQGRAYNQYYYGVRRQDDADPPPHQAARGAEDLERFL